MHVISSAAASKEYMLHRCLRKEKKRKVYASQQIIRDPPKAAARSIALGKNAREAHVMAMRMMMTMRMAPNLPRSATAAAGGTKPARTLTQMETREKRKGYAFWRQFYEKPSNTLGCPGVMHRWTVMWEATAHHCMPEEPLHNISTLYVTISCCNIFILCVQ